MPSDLFVTFHGGRPFLEVDPLENRVLAELAANLENRLLLTPFFSLVKRIPEQLKLLNLIVVTFVAATPSRLTKNFGLTMRSKRPRTASVIRWVEEVLRPRFTDPCAGLGTVLPYQSRTNWVPGVCPSTLS